MHYRQVVETAFCCFAPYDIAMLDARSLCGSWDSCSMLRL